MNQALRVFVRFCILGMSGVFLAHPATAAEPRHQRLEKILADWQKRQHWSQTVEYKVSGTHKVPKGAYNKLPAETSGSAMSQVSPPRDVEAPVSFTILLDFDKGRYRRESCSQSFDASSGSLVPLVTKDVFNGSVMKILTPREENPQHKVGITHPEMSITSGNMKNGQFISDYFPIFFAHGRVYTDMKPILPGQLRGKPDPKYFYIHGQGVHEDSPCLILRTQTLKMATTSYDEYWVDASRDSAIVRYLNYSGKKIVQDINIHYGKSHDHWLPESWRWTVYIREKTLYYDEVRVKQITVNPSITDADFELEVKPGMLVEEVTSLPTNGPLEWPRNKVSIYRVKERGEREEIPDPFHRPGDQYQEHRSRLWAWLWIVPFVIAVSFGIFWVRYRKSAMR